MSFVILYQENERKSGSQLLILFSISLTILSLISSISLFILRAINYKVKYSSQVRQITQIEAKFTIHCNQFQNCHAFTNHMIRDEMIKAIRRYDSDDDEVINLWSDRQDTGLENDVFYI